MCARAAHGRCIGSFIEFLRWDDDVRLETSNIATMGVLWIKHFHYTGGIHNCVFSYKVLPISDSTVVSFAETNR